LHFFPLFGLLTIWLYLIVLNREDWWSSFLVGVAGTYVLDSLAKAVRVVPLRIGGK